jgi:hypothetical protein
VKSVDYHNQALDRKMDEGAGSRRRELLRRLDERRRFTRRSERERADSDEGGRSRTRRRDRQKEAFSDDDARWMERREDHWSERDRSSDGSSEKIRNAHKTTVKHQKASVREWDLPKLNR